MTFRILEPRQLSPDLLDAWDELRKSNPDLPSPFFCPDFILAVADAREDVWVAVIGDKGSIAGFFPFQIERKGFGKPVGEYFSDYQGIICSPGFDCDAFDLLRACGLMAWDFNHLVVGQRCFSRFQRQIEASPLLDLTRGFKAYLQDRSATGTSLIKEIAKKTRWLEREAGKVRFVAHAWDESILRQVLSWRAANLGQPLILDTPWISKTLNTIGTTEKQAFAGVLSALYAGDLLIAGHFGMRSETVWHWWLAGYNPEYKRYSPGSILLYKIAEAAPGMNIRIIDLGKGQELYKSRFKNSEAYIAEGSVERGAFLRCSRKIGRNVHKLGKSALNNTVLEGPARDAIAMLRRSPIGGVFGFFKPSI